jgi:hypothetical protein
MTTPTGVPPVFEILIRWSPTGQMQAVFPQVDPTLSLGMLEMAKALLHDQRQKAQEQRVIPAKVIPS